MQVVVIDHYECHALDVGREHIPMNTVKSRMGRQRFGKRRAVPL